MSAEGYYLIAHVVNGTDLARAEVELEVAAESTDGDWFTNDGRQVWPFWTQPIDFTAPAIPEGWIEHLHELAAKTCRAPSRDLISLLGLIHKPLAQAAPLKRRF